MTWRHAAAVKHEPACMLKLASVYIARFYKIAARLYVTAQRFRRAANSRVLVARFALMPPTPALLLAVLIDAGG